jgi:DnaK suppressor protein
MAVRAINTDFKTKKAVETAMALLETGDYGICQECGEPINPKRLEAIPWTTLCVRCQENRDSVIETSEDDADFERAA